VHIFVLQITSKNGKDGITITLENVRGDWATKPCALWTSEEAPVFKLPAYDPTAIAMLGFGILAALSVPFIF
jgi:hypothetical protein